MTAYVANHKKKARILDKREQELMHAIKNNFSKDKIGKCAKKVREAQLNVYKARFAQNNSSPPSSYVPDNKAKEWESMSLEEIVKIYEQKNNLARRSS